MLAAETHGQFRVEAFLPGAAIQVENVCQLGCSSALRTVERPISSLLEISVYVDPAARIERATANLSSVITVGRPPTRP